jgi:hypothetical protein
MPRPLPFKRPAKPPKRRDHMSGNDVIIVIATVGAIIIGLYLSGIDRGPKGKIGCTDAEIAANAPCRD